MQNLFFIAAILIVGAGGMVAQLVLLRELLVTFYGNELTIGIILANWVILEAVGAFFLGRAVERTRNKVEVFVLLQLIFSASFLVAIYLTRTLKDLLGVPPGVGLGFLPIMYSSFLLLLPVSVSHGALFTFGCKIYASRLPGGNQAREASSIGMVYVYETLGTIIGGIAFTYILIPYFHSFVIAFVIVLSNLLAALLLLSPFWQKGQGAMRRNLAFLCVTLLALCIFSVTFKWAGGLQDSSVRRQWKGRGVIHYQNSIYSNIVVTKTGEQYSFYSNGIPIVIAPTPDITFVEEFAHFPMLFHASPEEVLVISGGAGGLINELLKHPVKRIDYVELDPLIIELVKKYPTPMTEVELSDPHVQIKNVDGRLFVRKTKRSYDVILIGLSNPSDLQTNRLFTEEFFRLAKIRLKKGGIFAITLPGSLAYMGPELRELNASILNTLKKSFHYTRIIPGDFNLFLSSDSSAMTEVEPEIILQRLGGRRLSLKLFTPLHVNYRMHKRWLNSFLKSVEGRTGKPNKDFTPLGVFYNLAYWNAQFSPYLNWLFKGLMKGDVRILSIPIFIIMAALLFLAGRFRRFAHLGIPFCIVTSGFAGMIFDLILIFSFQILYGYVYHQIGLLVTAFMAGSAIGGLAMTRLLGRLKDNLKFFVNLEVGVIVFSIIIPLVIFAFSANLDRPAIPSLFAPAFLGLCLISGLVIGLQFPLANRLYLKASPGVSHAAGLLYGADLFGGWIGGIIGGIILMPLLGLAGTCLILVLLKVFSLLFLIATRRHWA